ncbi:MAG: hypothetical protein RQ824_03555 [bacterium]|nr:hypothetical protein [bacterium]
MIKRFLFITASLLMFAAPSAFSAELVVISSHETSEKISSKLLRKIYLKRKILWQDKTRIVPVNLPARSSLRAFFTKETLHMDHKDLVLYWNEQHYKGVRPPVVVESEEAVKAFVREVKGALGYINADSLEPDLKVLYRIREGE